VALIVAIVSLPGVAAFLPASAEAPQSVAFDSDLSGSSAQEAVFIGSVLAG
jgi:hypothetical protein